MLISKMAVMSEKILVQNTEYFLFAYIYQCFCTTILLRYGFFFTVFQSKLKPFVQKPGNCCYLVFAEHRSNGF